MHARTEDHFRPDYASARAAFLAAARAAGARLGGRALTVRGGDDRELTIDTARLGPDEPEALVVLSSGTHGVEGFAGSALQHLLLRHWPSASWPKEVGLLLVHAVNPWGFDALRRVNERNVDLNRNFLAHPEEHEARPDYCALDPHINPCVLDAEHDQRAREVLAGFARDHGGARLQEVLSEGQHERPEGLQYGGREAEESNRLLRELAARETRGAARVAWIDLHTGLGPFGVPELITELTPDDPVYHRGRAWFGDAFRSTRAGESVSAPLCGVIETGLTEAVAEGIEFTPFTAEFGTVPAERVFWALRADNWLHHHGDLGSERAAGIRAELLHAFRPEDARWKRAVLERGRDVVQRTAAGVARGQSA